LVQYTSTSRHTRLSRDWSSDVCSSDLLAESFETALKLADGIALVAPMDEGSNQEELIFSARFACPVCGHSISELEPKLFSFNNPAGACGTCDGLGVHQFFAARHAVTGPASPASRAVRGL